MAKPFVGTVFYIMVVFLEKFWYPEHWEKLGVWSKEQGHWQELSVGFGNFRECRGRWVKG